MNGRKVGKDLSVCAARREIGDKNPTAAGAASLAEGAMALRVPSMTALTLGVLGVGAAYSPHVPAGLPQLLVLRGGVQPAVIERPTNTPAPAATTVRSTPSNARNRPKPKTRRRRDPNKLSLQDAATAALSLSALGAAHYWNDAYMEAVPKGSKDVAWMFFGSLLCSFMYMIMRVLNYDRAMAINRSLAKLLLGDSTTKGVVSSGPALALITLLGGLASFQTLPSMAG